MNRIALVLVALALHHPASGQEKSGSRADSTITGTVVCVEEYKLLGRDARNHIECADAGGRLGIVTRSGVLYVALPRDDFKLNPNAVLRAFAGKTVEVRGEIRREKADTGIVIRSVSYALTKGNR